MAKVSNELITRFAFEGSIAPLQQFNLSMVGSLKNLGLLAGAFAGMAGAIGKWVTNISASQDATGQLSRSIGVSVEALGELGYAASQNGSSVDKMRESLSNLSEKIGEASIRGSEEFSRLGISVRDAGGKVKSADKVFMEFAARSKQLGLSQQQIQSFAQKLGIDRSLVQLIGKSSEEITGLRKEAIALGRVTTEQSDQMLKYNDTLDTLNHALNGVKVQVAVALIPQLKQLAETFTKKLTDSAQTIVKVLKVMSEVFEAVIRSIIRMAPVLSVLAAGFLLMKVVTLGWAGALKILMAATPYAIFLMLYLIVEDLIAAFEGGSSVFADFYYQLSGGRDLVEDLTGVWNGFVKVLGFVIDKLQPIWEMIQDVSKGLASIGGTAVSFIGNLFGGDDAPQPSTQQMMQPSNTSSNTTSNVNQEVKIEVRSDNPEAAGKAVKTALDQQLTDAQLQNGAVAR